MRPDEFGHQFYGLTEWQKRIWKEDIAPNRAPTKTMKIKKEQPPTQNAPVEFKPKYPLKTLPADITKPRD
jgi:hypothetical protein